MILIAQGLAIGFRARIYNIGAEGQLIMGALFGGGVAIYAEGSDSAWVLPAMVLAGAIGGGLWGALPALLKTRFNAEETLTTLMLTSVANYNHHFPHAAFLYLIDQPEITTEMAFKMIRPFAFQGVGAPHRSQRVLIGDERQHGLFQGAHVGATSLREAQPVSGEGFRVVAQPGQYRPSSASGWLRDHRTAPGSGRIARCGRGRWRALLPWPPGSGDSAP